MKHKTIHTEAQSDAPPSEVWRLLADVTTWTDWAGFHEAAYEREAPADRHGVGAIRRFRIGPLRSLEHVLEFVPEQRFVYDYQGTLPIQDYRAVVSLRPTSSGGTHITWHSTFRGRFPLAGSLVKVLLAQSLSMTATRLADAAAVASVPRAA
jgi:uncharacterized protein YndB with AHSA1/START domain